DTPSLSLHDALPILGRLALSEAVDSARAVCAEYMQGTRQVDGWVRQLDSDPCELCRWWHRDGRIWPASHTMPAHKGCACAQRWRSEEHTSELQSRFE